ncbi:hypothetical protein JOD45_001158 [Scopulibacillus daqui]|uniref:DUF4064 domain-containing protein n=1 Tax=Scopulibacillus daqui TaxID=1469162 RepID=A0ABS2PY35_9BACL|nr:DUF4064 domain-containing protein [Scopulibacillus daqui]MBM7644949.1 hypothetical protein [Scopulibacillus daqui]
MKRNTEFTLSLIATIFLTIGWFFTAIMSFLLSFMPADADGFGWFVYLLICTIFSIPLLVLIWIATFKIRNNSKGWGIFILIMGVFYTFSIYFVPGILLLIAGIMMVAKNDKSKSMNLSA